MATQDTTYTYCERSPDHSFGDGIPLTAKTDEGARRQARKLAKERKNNDWYVSFFRRSDGCKGTL